MVDVTENLEARMYHADLVKCTYILEYPRKAGTRITFVTYPLGKDRLKNMDKWVFSNVNIEGPRCPVSSHKNSMRDVFRIWKQVLECTT